VIVENGTRDDERAVATTLGELTDCVTQQGLKGPAVIFVGLDWATGGLQRPASVTVHRAQRQPAARPDLESPIGKEVWL
jgi:uroporphyrin-III C-methyltransferase/precorrin-2 dehydrogenase/sirohydrochlorin ferrochelatase